MNCSLRRHSASTLLLPIENHQELILIRPVDEIGWPLFQPAIRAPSKRIPLQGVDAEIRLSPAGVLNAMSINGLSGRIELICAFAQALAASGIRPRDRRRRNHELDTAGRLSRHAPSPDTDDILPVIRK